MTPSTIRKHSARIANSLGFRTIPHLPLIDDVSHRRSEAEVIDRFMALCVVVAVSHGFDREEASEWLDRESLWRLLTDKEEKFVVNSEGDPLRIHWLVEALWALAWALRLVNDLDFTKYSDDQFFTLWPDLKVGEPSARVRRQCHLRPQDEIRAAYDLALCLHWDVVEAALAGRKEPGVVPGEVIIQRRRALSWLLHDEDWDAVPMDT